MRQDAAGGAASRCSKREEWLSGGNADRCGLYQPLARAFQTAEILAKEGKLPLRRLTGLRERDFGCWEGKSWQQVEAEYPDEFHLWREQPMVGIRPAENQENPARRGVNGRSDRFWRRQPGMR